MDVLKKNPMPTQEANVRNKNFDEVALGYTEEIAVDEATRCLNCKTKPCVKGCPVNVKIPEFISHVKQRNFKAAYETIKETNSLPAVCGRVCPQESQCEKGCIRAIKGESVAIGRLERFVADWAMKNYEETTPEIDKNNKKVAVVGSGPSGLTCAGDLAKMGYDVTVFEAFHTPGGVLMYGIPQFRLPKEIVKKEIGKLQDMGVHILTNSVIGRMDSIDELLEEYEAVYVATGAGLPSFMGIPGEALNGVFSANEYLTRINLMKAYDERYDTPIIKYKNVAVVGGGNVAMDAARCAKRMGAENVYIIYRRSDKEMPARAEEVHHAKEEGVVFKTLTNIKEILGDENGNVRAVKCVEMELGESDESGRRRPVEKTDCVFEIPMDAVIMSIGTSPNPLIKNTTKGLETNKRGCIVADEVTGETSKKGVYSGGDSVTGAATVILAMGAGKASAKAIDEYIKQKN